MLEQHRPCCFPFEYTRPFSLKKQQVSGVLPTIAGSRGHRLGAKVPAKSHLWQDAKRKPEMEKARQRRAFACVLPETRQPTRTVSGDEDCQAIYVNLTAPR